MHGTRSVISDSTKVSFKVLGPVLLVMGSVLVYVLKVEGKVGLLEEHVTAQKDMAVTSSQTLEKQSDLLWSIDRRLSRIEGALEIHK